MPDAVERRANGISYLERVGPGPVVMLLHGIGSNAGTFTPLFDFLPDDFHIIAWNAPGYMDSDRLTASWPSPDDYAEALAGFLNDVGVKSVYLLGHSLGCLVAAAFSQRFPSRVKKLVLAAAANGYGIAQGEELPATTSNRIEELERLGAQEFAQKRAPNLVHEPLKHPHVVARVEAAMAQVRFPGYRQAVHMLACGNLASMVAQVERCPGFIIGAQDRVTPMEQTQKAVAAWSAAHGYNPPLVVIEEAGHAAYVQRPKRFAAALLKLLADNTMPNGHNMACHIDGERHDG